MLDLPQPRDQAQAVGQAEEQRGGAGQDAVGGGHRGDPDRGAKGGGYTLAPGGAAEFGRFGVDVDRLERRTRPLLRPCLDWSERRYHLAGSLGAALTRSMIERRWITTREASRIVAVTEAGEAGLRDWLAVDLAQLRSAA